MFRKTVIVVAVVAIGCAGWTYYQRSKSQVDLSSGEVYSSDDPAPDSQPRPVESAVRDSRPTPVNGSSTLRIPTGDSIPANPPNGQTFSGNGAYQVYRQGNLTWRINTQSGETCILFATPEEWRKPIVYNHGCGAS